MDEATKAELDAAKVIDRKLDDISQRYELGEMLGEGRFSQVFSASRAKQHYALKAVHIATLEEDEEAVEALVQETTALRRAYAAASRRLKGSSIGSWATNATTKSSVVCAIAARIAHTCSRITQPRPAILASVPPFSSANCSPEQPKRDAES